MGSFPSTTAHTVIFRAVILLGLAVSSCKHGSGGNVPPTGIGGDADLDGDGLTNSQELALGTNPGNPDTDGDGIWDGEELDQFHTSPLAADTDGDGYLDREDPKPTDPSLPSGSPRHYAVFTIGADGSHATPLVETRYLMNHLTFTPDGKSLLYQFYREDENFDGEYDEGDILSSAIGIMNADGSRPRILVDVPGAIDAPLDISPDGKHVVFASDRQNPGSYLMRLYAADIDGENQKAILFASDAPAANDLDADPCWGPGNKFSFKRENLGPSFSRIFTADIDPATMTLSNLVVRTTGPAGTLANFPPGDYDPKISPDGLKIASYRHRDDSILLGSFVWGDWDLWVGDYADPTHSIQFVNPDPAVADLFPRWNPAGTKLAIWALDANALAAGQDFLDVYLLNPDGTGRVNLTGALGWSEMMPNWHPSGGSLVYSAWR